MNPWTYVFLALGMVFFTVSMHFEDKGPSHWRATFWLMVVSLSCGEAFIYLLVRS